MKRKSDIGLDVVDENRSTLLSEVPNGKRKRKSRGVALSDQSNHHHWNYSEDMDDMGVRPIKEDPTPESPPPDEKNDSGVYVFRRSKRGVLEFRSGPNYFASLSDELMVLMFRWLPKVSLAKCALVCKRWRQIAYDESLWKRLDLGLMCLPPHVLGTVIQRGAVMLRLARTIISPPAFETSSSSFFLSMSSKLQYLDLSMSSISLPCLLSLLSCTVHLKKLSLEHVPLNTAVLKAIAQNTSLTVLQLGMVTGLSKSGLKFIFDSVSELEELNLGWSDLNMESLNYLSFEASSIKSLKRVNLSGCREFMSDVHVESISLRFSNLRELDVSDSSGLTSASIDFIVKNCRKIEHLSFNRCYGIVPSSYLKLTQCSSMKYLNIFGIMKPASFKELKSRLTATIELNKFLFTTIARPTVGMRRSSIWTLRIRD